MGRISVVGTALALALLVLASSSGAADGGKGDGAAEALSRLEALRDRAAAEVRAFDEEIRKADARIVAAEGLAARARQQGNGKAEAAAREALAKSQEAKRRNGRNREAAAAARDRAERALAAVRSGRGSARAAAEQVEFENLNDEWRRKQNELIGRRLAEPNGYASDLYRSLKANAPPPPWKEYDRLLPGDVLLLEGKGIAAADNRVTAGEVASKASHTVIFLKEVDGEKLYLDNQPGEGPRILSEREFLDRYGARGTEVARLAQPLTAKEGKDLFSAAVEMAAHNRREIAKNWFGSPLLGTDYGAWGKDDVVCSEADWMLLNRAVKDTRGQIAWTGDAVKHAAGLSFTPADYSNSPYFLVTPLRSLPEGPSAPR